MRIIAGKLGGRQFDSPKSKATHPMSEKVRGAIFNALGDIEGLTVLDAFAGSGALSFEAISRGAKSVIAIDNDKSAQRMISENIRLLGFVREVKLVKAAAGSWLETTDDKFDLVLLDPPYDDVQLKLLEKLANRARPGGVIIISLPPTSDFSIPNTKYQILNSKTYGDATLTFYRRV